MWRKSSHSGYNGNCVEVTQTPDLVLVRDSKEPAGPVLEFSTPEWREFVARLMAGKPGHPPPGRTRALGCGSSLRSCGQTLDHFVWSARWRVGASGGSVGRTAQTMRSA
jgi:hypothetical protein